MDRRLRSDWEAELFWRHESLNTRLFSHPRPLPFSRVPFSTTRIELKLADALVYAQMVSCGTAHEKKRKSRSFLSTDRSVRTLWCCAARHLARPYILTLSSSWLVSIVRACVSLYHEVLVELKVHDQCTSSTNGLSPCARQKT
jgi:hypothetical protein